MAAPSGGDENLRPLQHAMKLATRAIQLDTGNKHKVRKEGVMGLVNPPPLSIISCLICFAASKVLASDSQKLLKLAAQCLERAQSTAGKLGQIYPPPCETPSAPLVSSYPPLALTFGHRRACSDKVPTRSPFPTPEVFRMLRAAEAAKPKTELTPLEEASVQNQKLRASYEARLSRLNPNQASQKTSLASGRQIGNAQAPCLKIRGDPISIPGSSLPPYNADLSKEEEEQLALYTAVMEYDHDHRGMIEQCVLNALSSCISVYFLSCHDHPITRLVERLQFLVYDQLYPFIIAGNQPTESFPESHHQSLPVNVFALPASGPSTLKTSQSLQCLPSAETPLIRHSTSAGDVLLDPSPFKPAESGRTGGELETSFEDLESLLPPKDIQKLTTQERLNYMVKEIHHVQDEMLASVLISLDLPNIHVVRYICLECLDESFFPQLWPPLIALYKQAFCEREESLLQKMNVYATCDPSVIGIPLKLVPEDIKEPYKDAADELGNIEHIQSLQGKLECITLWIACECVENYNSKRASFALCADYLLPLLVYILITYRMSHLLSECFALEEFFHRDRPDPNFQDFRRGTLPILAVVRVSVTGSTGVASRARLITFTLRRTLPPRVCPPVARVTPDRPRTTMPCSEK
uniref:VPS9 domain containing 1 n=1 Tax=Leptobrachium leishanense TaxID=445787 RepID=A0A8C5R3T4_9ANUR